MWRMGHQPHLIPRNVLLNNPAILHNPNDIPVSKISNWWVTINVVWRREAAFSASLRAVHCEHQGWQRVHPTVIATGI